MPLAECPPPDREDLAINRPEGDLHGYESALSAAHRYWSRKQQQGIDEVNPAQEDLSRSLCASLDLSVPQYINRRPDADPLAMERLRRIALNTLALSMLFRSLWGTTDDRLKDGIGRGRAQIIMDMYADADVMPLDYRIHALSVRGEDAPPEVWHKTSNLYVRQVRPVEPTDNLRSFLVEHSIAADFGQMETLYPYLASRV